MKLVPAILQIEFTGHFSEHTGVYYSADGPEEAFTVESYLAADEDGSYFLEEEFPAYETMFRVDDTNRGDSIRRLRSAADGLTFLRRDYPFDKGNRGSGPSLRVNPCPARCAGRPR